MSKKIPVVIGGVEYESIIDENGVQRFEGNEVIRYLSDTGIIDLNQLYLDYRDGKFSQRDYLEFYISLGYSVTGIAELSMFKDIRIENPKWEEDREPVDNYHEYIQDALTGNN